MYQESIVDMFKTIDAEDWSSLRRFYGEGCVYERPGFDVIEGLDALIHFYESVRPIRSGTHSLDYVIKERGRVVASGIFEGTLQSGSSIQMEFMDLYVFDRDKIQFMKTFIFGTGVISPNQKNYEAYGLLR
jgi:hypothetical protein